MLKSGNAHTARPASLRRLTADGWRLSEQWIEPDPWSWVYFSKRATVFIVLVLGILTGSACAHPPSVPPIVVPPPVVVLVLPGPLTHDIGAWPDADTVCVPTPPVQAIYRERQCLSMATIRSLILTARWAE